jgi:histidinol-phosphate aminotransferase
MKERIRIINLVAAEHLHVECENAASLLPLIQNSGAVFLGAYSPVPLGDYCAGTNHVLPTSGYSRFYSGLSLFDFVKLMDVLDCKPSGLIALEKILAPIAKFEGLPGHYASVKVRADYLAANPNEILKDNPLADPTTFPVEVKKLCRKAFEKLTAYTPGEQPQDMELWVKLNTNENPSEPPEAVIKALEDAIRYRMRMYPDPESKKLREAIAKNYLTRFNTLNSPENIVVANGSDEMMDILFKTFVDPGDRVIFFKPSYGMYPTLTDTYEGTPVEISLDSDFQIPDTIYQERGKLMIICSPNNPSGTVVSNSVIEKICRSFNGIVYVDEAYSDFADTTALELLKTCPNLIVGRTFSKSFSLASVRLGFAITNTTITNLFNTIRLPYNVSYLTQVAGIAAMENWNVVQSRSDAIKQERNRVIQKFKAEGFEIFPTQSNFYLMKFSSAKYASEIYNGLKERKILARYWSKPELARYLRVTVGTKEQNEKFITAVLEIAKKLK